MKHRTPEEWEQERKYRAKHYKDKSAVEIIEHAIEVQRHDRTDETMLYILDAVHLMCDYLKTIPVESLEKAKAKRFTK